MRHTQSGKVHRGSTAEETGSGLPEKTGQISHSLRLVKESSHNSGNSGVSGSCMETKGTSGESHSSGSGVCGKCGKYKKLRTFGRHKNSKPLCHNCQRTRKEFTCKYCGKVGKSKGPAETCAHCYFKLGLNTAKVECKRCGETRPHYARGLCYKCYSYIRQRKWVEAHAEEVRVSRHKYYEDHKEQFYEYNKKYAQKSAMLTPERFGRIQKGVSFVTSGGIGVGDGKQRGRCVLNGAIDKWTRIVVYLTGENQYLVQLIYVKTGKEKFIKTTANGLMKYVQMSRVPMLAADRKGF